MSEYTMSELSDIFQNRIEQKEKADGFRLGFPQLDSLIDCESSGMLLLGRRPAMGGMAFGLSVICNNIIGNEEFVCTVFTRNSSPDAIYDRLISILSEVPIEHIRTKCFDSGELEVIERTDEFLRNKAISVIDSPVTEKEIEKKMEKIKREMGRLDLVIIDDLADIQPNYLNNNTHVYEKNYNIPYGCISNMISIKSRYYVDICRKLRQKSIDLGCYMIITVVLSLGPESRTGHIPELMDMRNHGRVYDAADRVLLLYREEYYRSDNDVRKGIMDVIVAKNATGRTGKTVLKINQETIGLSEPDCDTDDWYDVWNYSDSIFGEEGCSETESHDTFLSLDGSDVPF